MMRKSIHILSSSVLALAVLAACGGGGGSDASPTFSTTGGGAGNNGTPTTTTTPPPVTTSVPTTTGTPTAGATNVDTAAFDTLNSARSTCGFTTLSRNTPLDNAARNHADWQLRNNSISHDEVANTPGFTGANARDRALFVNYASNFAISDEISAVSGSSDKTRYGSSNAVLLLLNAPYHALGLLSVYRDVGISVRNNIDLNLSGDRVVTQLNLGYTQAAGAAEIADANTVLSYPCQGSQGVIPLLDNESPNPVPGRNLQTNPLGTSIMLTVQTGRTLRVTSASLTKVTTNTAVALRAAADNSNDTNLAAHQVFISADAPLETNTQYRAVINGTNNGATFTKTFSFTTGVNS